jgi:hypothetical protein
MEKLKSSNDERDLHVSNERFLKEDKRFSLLMMEMFQWIHEKKRFKFILLKLQSRFEQKVLFFGC